MMSDISPGGDSGTVALPADNRTALAGAESEITFKLPLDGFSEPGRKAYEEAVSNYIRGLANTSQTKALTKNASIAEPYHVQLAVDFLSGGRKGKEFVAHLSDIGILRQAPGCQRWDHDP